MIDISGTRVRLRSLQPGDIEILVAEREVEPFAGTLGPDESRERLRRQIEHGASLGADGFVDLAIEMAGSVVGDVQARSPRYAFPPGVCEIGIELFPGARGQGAGTEAVGLFTDYLLGDGWGRVQATTSSANVGMRRVLERAAYRFEGMLRAYGPTATGREDYAMYAAVRPR